MDLKLWVALSVPGQLYRCLVSSFPWEGQLRWLPSEVIYYFRLMLQFTQYNLLNTAKCNIYNIKAPIFLHGLVGNGGVGGVGVGWVVVGWGWVGGCLVVIGGHVVDMRPCGCFIFTATVFWLCFSVNTTPVLNLMYKLAQMCILDQVQWDEAYCIKLSSQIVVTENCM